MTALAHTSDVARPAARTRWDVAEACLAAVAFAVLCVLVLRASPYLPEPDDYAYRASIVAMTDGHFFTLSGAQAHALAEQLAPRVGGSKLGPGPGGGPVQWVQLPDGRWISEKDPGYPYLAAAFQALGIIRLAPLFYGALACLGLYFGGRRWLGRFGGAAAVGLYCSSGAAILFAWRDYMPTFTDASLIAAGTGALLWAVLAAEASTRRRTSAGLAGFVALEAATSRPVHQHRGAGLRGHRGAGRVAAAGRAAAGQRGRLVARVGVRVRRRGRDLRHARLRWSAAVWLPAGRDHLQPRRHRPELSLYASPPIQAMPMLVLGLTALAGIAVPGCVAAGRVANEPRWPGVTWRSGSRWPLRGPRSGACTPPTRGPRSRA